MLRRGVGSGLPPALAVIGVRKRLWLAVSSLQGDLASGVCSGDPMGMGAHVELMARLYLSGYLHVLVCVSACACESRAHMPW
jgi:hypothetical protein